MKLTNLSNTAARFAGKSYIFIALVSYTIPWTILTAYQLLQQAKNKLLGQAHKARQQN
ncbi:hypothetical protein [Umboniibacter marinipuniceus]|uniref:Uncharacterized protein n=1 Tax=Umboniibacter marinipuniceus TaxID=569599 RepID=A0A3M0A1J1_9GAMM|nr:hypothetical protein [Umboniibacter marinipuniceus]RMA78833.1 hypothetical protein DFR27_2172 [Umboniibacter marinipuniceus]